MNTTSCVSLRRCLPLPGSSPAGAVAAQPRPPVELDFVLSLTGNAAFLGKGEQQAFEVAEKVVNEAGGIRGRPVKFVYAGRRVRIRRPGSSSSTG